MYSVWYVCVLCVTQYVCVLVVVVLVCVDHVHHCIIRSYGWFYQRFQVWFYFPDPVNLPVEVFSGSGEIKMATGMIVQEKERHWHRPLLTGRPWRNRTLASQPLPQFMQHGQSGLYTVCKKIMSTRPNKYVEIFSGRWTAALFRSAGGSHPQNTKNTKAKSKKIDERHSMAWYRVVPGSRNHGFWPSQPVSKQYF